MLSEQSYYNLMENIYIIGSKNRYDWPMEFKTQLERGNVYCTILYRMKLLGKVNIETAGFFEKKKIRQFQCLQTDFIK